MGICEGPNIEHRYIEKSLLGEVTNNMDCLDVTIYCYSKHLNKHSVNRLLLMKQRVLFVPVNLM